VWLFYTCYNLSLLQLTFTLRREPKEWGSGARRVVVRGVLVWCAHEATVEELVFGVTWCALLVQGGIVRSLM